MSRTFRCVPFTIAQDTAAHPEYRAVCVTGEEGDCGEMVRSGSPGWVEEWMRRHTQHTGHTRYCRTIDDYAVLEPPPECVGRPVIGQMGAARPAIPDSGGPAKCEGAEGDEGAEGSEGT
ncbi:DUF7848 domain-containing protein [Streptomyces varsoviensis]|uniref:DUF7848 domain-containing protein n=1 Tax=Streptomyces varsoviensis TaxID=67373 RepID=UPI0007C5579C|nr:hypothetical protein [Streptomyces varsoviensis]